MNKLAAGLLTAAAGALIASPARAQIPHFTPFSFEARAGVAVPTGSFNDVADPGFALNGNITYHALPMLGIYVGGDHVELGGPGSAKYTDNGVDIGARLAIPTPLIPIDPYLKAGVVVHRLKLTDAGTANFSDSGTGVELGAGLGFGFGPLSLTPGITYVRYGYKPAGAAANSTASYVKADVGLRIRI